MRMALQRLSPTGAMRMAHLGMLSGGLARLAGLLLQVLAMPIVFRQLGQNGLGLFIALIGVVQLGSLAGLGSSKAVLHRAAAVGVASALARDCTVSLLLAGVVALLLAIPLGIGLFNWLETAEIELQLGQAAALAILVTVLFVMMAAFQLFIDLQMGWQRIWVVQLARAAGAMLALFGLAMLLPAHATVGTALALMGAGLLLAGLASWLATPVTFRRELLEIGPWPGFARRARELVVQGAPFLLVQGLAVAFLNLSPLVVALSTDVEQSVDFAIHARVLVLAWSLAAALVLPLWPSLRRMREEGDTIQMRQLLAQTGILVAGVALGFALAFAVAGAEIIALWIGHSIADYRGWALFVPLALAAVLANQFLGYALMGLGQVRLAALMTTLWCATALAVGPLASQRFGASAFFGVVAPVAALAALAQARALWKELR
jgi:O-antigen/teichoic acid export membrane protein